VTAAKKRGNEVTPLVDTPSGPLTARQDLFVTTYIENGGKKQAAALQAGYGRASAASRASRLLTEDKVLSEIYRRTKLVLASATPELLDTLMGLARKAKSERIRMEAAQDLLTRAGFSAPDRVDHRLSGDITVSIDIGS
jgi:phage terminase small subunit